MKSQKFVQRVLITIAQMLKTGSMIFALGFGTLLLFPSHAVAQNDTDLGQVESIDGKDQPNLHNLKPRTQPSHLWKRPDGTYYLKLGQNKLDATGVKVKTSNGTYTIPNKTNDQRVDNFHDDVRSFIDRLITSLPPSSPSNGTSFFPLNLTTALASEGDSSGMWEDPQTRTYGVVGFEVQSNYLSVLGSSTADGNTPVEYSFNASTDSWGLDLTGPTQFTFATDGIPQINSDGTEGWIFGSTPEPSSLLLLGSGVLSLSSLLRKRLHSRT
jgi:hypothetical protein